MLLSLQRSYVLRNRQFQLSTNNWFLKPKEIRPSERDEPITADDYSVPVKVTMRSVNAGPDELWERVEQVNFDDFDLQRAEGANVVSIYGTPPRIIFSMDNFADQVFTLWYEPTANRPQLLTDIPEIEDSFNTLMVYDSAIENGGRVLKQTAEYKEFWKDQRVLYVAKAVHWEEVMKEWMNKSRNQGRAYKRTFPYSTRVSRQQRIVGGRYTT